MIKINNITAGRFGNRILQYNSAYQLAKKLKTNMYCVEWEGNQFFDLPSHNEEPSSREEKLLTWRDCINPLWDDIKSMHEKFDLVIDDPAYLLHNTFFQLTHVDVREIFSIKKEFLPKLEAGTTNLGIHIRGGDTRGGDNNNCREIHTFEYYKNAIDEALKNSAIDNINITSDDTDFDLFKKVLIYSDKVSGDAELIIGAATFDSSMPHIYDFALLAECDYLIAGSSTYAVCAGIIGKNKKIIHSSEWIQKNIPGSTYVKWGNYTTDYPETYWRSWDNFWIKVNRGGNKFYSPWKIL